MATNGMEVNRMIKKIIVIVFSFVTLLFIIFLVGNHYNMSEETDTIDTPIGNLSTVITHPKDKNTIGIVIFVHGDGAQNATLDGGYKPLMERFAKQGFISISWDKLGIGKSSGNWLDQTMDDRSKEVSYVISWLKKKYPKESNNIGLWGASQAGWVIPRILNEREDIRFSILVGPAINWLRQGEYDTVQNLKINNKNSIYEAKQDFMKDSELIEQNNTYKDYRASGGLKKYNLQRYAFIKKNMHEDATKYLKNIHSDLFLVLAEKDFNVDSNETEKVYSKEIDSQYLEIKKIKKVGHQMINLKIKDSTLLINLTAILMPKYFLIDSSYLDYCEDIARKYNSMNTVRNE